MFDPTKRDQRKPSSGLDLSALDADARLDTRAVCALRGCSASHLRRDMAAGRWPVPDDRGKRFVRWRVASVRAALALK
jgi:predicted DNA-binding transcriptional regulator AlpA